MTTITAPFDLGSSRGRVWKQVRTNRLGMTGGIMLAVVVLAGVTAPLVAPYDPTTTHFDLPFQVPFTVGFGLGTDDLGRDILSRTLYGIQVSLVVGVLSVLLAVVVGTPLGLLAGYWRWLDAIISRLTDVALAFPFLIIAVGLAAISGPSLTNAVVAIGISHVPAMIRIVRGETLRITSADFVTSAKTLDAGGARIILQHVLPNCVSAIIVQATVIMPVAVIGEALLSFLGLGIQPPTPSLGIMLSDAQQYLGQAPWAAVVPGVAIAVVCLGFNLFGDALRDALDPTASDRK
ncbi:ABC transporter permease [Curtobacterium sp. C1]|uniref:ABC transporter permease n=1 Tax=Curtobacterium citreum TaxID=2036 RepID=A0A850DUD8_9MICO|nr:MULTISPECIES: ABC transporter permease [Curtobacterium]MCS5485948.1 ABC transporter permease [Curtobacterium flaccumfaciens pv. basellae]MDK8171561.1 ABC transporter permease [Curtobacterium citreum]NUU28974.1 ABC transporter permease [Curtobacterium albidum]QKS17799.1 ABC transporter permease [Curtobacterium sp. Csp2]UFU14332.1 ABC transporter permease [Curtobacterium sp. C1]